MNELKPETKQMTERKNDALDKITGGLKLPTLEDRVAMLEKKITHLLRFAPQMGPDGSGNPGTMLYHPDRNPKVFLEHEHAQALHEGWMTLDQYKPKEDKEGK